eukprot:scaffold44392_cov41-Tisochrysis_lutea.AAC.2
MSSVRNVVETARLSRRGIWYRREIVRMHFSSPRGTSWTTPPFLTPAVLSQLIRSGGLISMILEVHEKESPLKLRNQREVAVPSCACPHSSTRDSQGLHSGQRG